MASISFTDEASESFATFVQGFYVEVTPADGGAKFYAEVVGSAAEELDDYFAVRLQKYTAPGGSKDGEPFALVVADLKVY